MCPASSASAARAAGRTRPTPRSSPGPPTAAPDGGPPAVRRPADVARTVAPAQRGIDVCLNSFSSGQLTWSSTRSTVGHGQVGVATGHVEQAHEHGTIIDDDGRDAPHVVRFDEPGAAPSRSSTTLQKPVSTMAHAASTSTPVDASAAVSASARRRSPAATWRCSKTAGDVEEVVRLRVRHGDGQLERQQAQIDLRLLPHQQSALLDVGLAEGDGRNVTSQSAARRAGR